LAQQIENGAPYDLFLSANAEYVDRLASTGKISAGTVRSYATGRVALLWRDKKSHEFKDLGESWVRFVALPNPKLAPYGVAAQQALEHAGIWDRVEPKVVYGENVRQTLELFDTGNADAVLTADSLVQGRDAMVVPPSWHRPIAQKAGVVADRPNQDAAEQFLQFLLSPEAQAIFAHFGFGAPGN
jgi:molybdate transport system substrate-binding protein